MSLKLAYKKTIGGIEIPFLDAIHRIDQLNYGKNKDGTKSFCVSLGTYSNDKNLNDSIDTKFYGVTLNESDGSYVSQAYLFLKTLPEFEGASDC
jgi:hypothetical protein